MKKKSQQTKYVRGTNTAGTNPSFLCPDRKEYTHDNAVTSPDAPKKNIQTSVRATRPVGEGLVKELLSAAMSAPTAGGIQPWRFVVITDREKLDKIPDFHPYAGMIKQAPLAILVCGDTTSANYGKYWVQDCSAAMENLLLAARAKELASLWCGVHPVPEREQAFRELFNLPDTVSPLGLAILGYSETPFSHKERYDEQKVHYNVW